MFHSNKIFDNQTMLLGSPGPHSPWATEGGGVLPMLPTATTQGLAEFYFYHYCLKRNKQPPYKKKNE